MTTFGALVVGDTFHFVSDYSKGHFSSGETCRKISETQRVYQADKTNTPFECGADLQVIKET